MPPTCPFRQVFTDPDGLSSRPERSATIAAGARVGSLPAFPAAEAGVSRQEAVVPALGSRRRRRVGRIAKWFAVVACACSLATAGYLAYVGVRRQQPVALPALDGSYQVGRVTFEWTDRSRVDPLAPRPGRSRALSVWLWYPTLSATAGSAASYAPGAWQQLHLPGLVGWFETDFAKVSIHAREHVPVAAGRFPVVVLEPGLGFSAPQYQALAEGLASHGYLVAGLTPTYSANVSVLDGHVLHATPAGNPPDLGGHSGRAGAAADRLVDVWAADAHFVAARVTELARTSAFAGRIDTSAVAYVGHSFGGAASLQACATDPRCRTAVDVDGTQFGTVVQTGLHVPFMVLTSAGSCVSGTCQVGSQEDDADRAAARSLLAASTGHERCYAITGTRHFNFTDDAALYLAPPVRALFALGSIQGQRGLAIQNRVIAGFLDHALHRGPAATPTPAVRHDEVRDLCSP